MKDHEKSIENIICQLDVLKRAVRDSSKNVHERWELAKKIQPLLTDETTSCPIEHLSVDGESFGVSADMERNASRAVWCDDFLDHLVFPKVPEKPKSTEVFYTAPGKLFEEWFDTEDMIDPSLTETVYETAVWPEEIYCSYVKIKQGVTIEEVKEILLQADPNYRYDW